MHRRDFNQAGVSALGALILATYQQAHALSLGDLAGISNTDASAGLKTALEKSFDSLELQIRRKFPAMAAQGGLLASQQNAAILLGQVRALLPLVTGDDLQFLVPRLEKLYLDAGSMGVEMATLVAQKVDPEFTMLRPKISTKAIEYSGHLKLKQRSAWGDLH